MNAMFQIYQEYKFIYTTVKLIKIKYPLIWHFHFCKIAIFVDIDRTLQINPEEFL